MGARRQAREDRTRQLILDTLRQNPDGLTISEISRMLSIHYTTASKYLAVLEAAEKVVHRDVGMAKMFKILEESP